MLEEKKIARVVTRRSLRAKNNDLAFWQRMSPEARIAALEEMRQQYNDWVYGAKSRLQRVYTIVKRK
jgi:hypothetical protein